ncbi:MAG: DNA polymerase-3 subunit epsilon [Colwellia sp.]|jgi:DNA polymerase-3 subunit epsilon
MSIEQDVQPDERLIILDTETTGINPREGHRIVEVGCVEMINRQLTGRSFHVYINPLFEMEQEVINIHGLTNDFLRDKPLFTQVADEFIEFIKGARLVIHNAKFDIGFMDNEFSLLKRNIPNTRDMCTVIDTLHVSKDEFGSPKTLDYLARFYRVDKLVDRTYHGALVDAQLLAFVYIEMTRKQSVLNLSAGSESGEDSNAIRRISSQRTKLKVIQASADELIKHDERLAVVANKGSEPIWPK